MSTASSLVGSPGWIIAHPMYVDATLHAVGGGINRFVSPTFNGSTDAAFAVDELVDAFQMLGGRTVLAIAFLTFFMYLYHLIRWSVATTAAARSLTMETAATKAANANEEEDLSSVIGCASHVAIIMDGNRRYGKSRLGGAINGHREGGETLMRVIDWAIEFRIEALTVYAFSTENWQRSALEVSALMQLFQSFFQRMRSVASAKGLRLRFLSSEPELLPADVYTLMDALEVETRMNATITINVCVSYGGRSSIVQACRRLSAQGGPSGGGEATATVSSPAEACGGSWITEAAIRHELSRSITELNGSGCEAAAEGSKTASTTILAHQASDAAAPPPAYRRDPDLLLRTSGEQRLSNFLLYELAYAEMSFIPCAWPEMTREMLRDVLQEFASRKRRFGT